MQVHKSVCLAIKKSLSEPTSYTLCENLTKSRLIKVDREQGIRVRCTLQLLTISIAIACRVK